MEPNCGLCHLLHYVSLKLLLTKFYAKLGTLVIGHTLESPIALRELLLSVVLFSTISVPSSLVLFPLLTSFYDLFLLILLILCIPLLVIIFCLVIFIIGI